MNDLEGLGKKKLKRDLYGHDPTDVELVNKLMVLEQVLNGKKEVFLNKEIVIDELNSMVENFKSQAEETRCKNLQVVSQSNFLKSKLKKLVKKIMMFVSELSIF